MQPGKNKNFKLFNNKLLIGLLACMIYRILTIFLSIAYIQFFIPHKIYISTNLYGFYLYLALVFCLFIVAVIPRQAIGITVAIGSTLILGWDMLKADLPYRAFLFVFSSCWAYLFVFISNRQFKKEQLGALTSKAVTYLKYILLIVYPLYLFFEKEAFRNMSLLIAGVISLAFFISWLNNKLQ